MKQLKNFRITTFAVSGLLALMMVLLVAVQAQTAGRGAMPNYEAGTLLKGSNHFVYYLTDGGRRQPILNHETFEAFGFQAEEVILVDDETLADIPLDEVLTPLVFDQQNNLYWINSGQRHWVDEWKSVLADGESYQGMPSSRIDERLAKRLTLRRWFKQGSLFRDGETVYMFYEGSLLPIGTGSYTETDILELPSPFLATYRQESELTRLVTRLQPEIHAANVRRGPSTEFEAIGAVDPTDKIVVTGRATGSYWLQIEYDDQIGWLAGDLVKQQLALPFLRQVEPTEDEPAEAQAATPHDETEEWPPYVYGEGIFSGLGIWVEARWSYIDITGIMKNSSAHYAGLKKGDQIVSIDGQAITGWSSEERISDIRGPEGTYVSLTIFRRATNERFNRKIIRELIDSAQMTAVCDEQPIRGFGNSWRENPEVQHLLGCPFTNFRRDEHATASAVQTFEHGWMLWLETDTVMNIDPIYVFFEDDDSYIRYGDRALTDAHSYAMTPPGFHKIGDRFSKVYWEEIGASGRARLGNAINEARDSSGAFQEFEKGRMFWSGEADRIYVIYQGYYDVDQDGQQTYKRGWVSFEDTFEAEE